MICVGHLKLWQRRFGTMVGCSILIAAWTLGEARESLNLAGEWRLRLDADDAGLKDNWPRTPLSTPDRIALPNTTDHAGFGFALDTNTMRHTGPFPVTTRFPGIVEPERADEHGYLVRRHLFVGPAWYEREVVVPESWRGMQVILTLERAIWQTEVWVDGKFASACDSLVVAHRHELGALTPGTHRLTIRVDNRMIYNLSTVTHAYGPETQSRWNGLIGNLKLTAVPTTSIRLLATYPASDRRSVRVVMITTNAGTAAASVGVQYRLLPESGESSLSETRLNFSCPPGTTTNEAILTHSTPAQAWDEFQTARYRLNATLTNPDGKHDETSITFGFRQVERVGKEIHVNGRRIFLRGTLDCAVYPRTGHPPMTVAEWLRVLEIVKEYGFNHVRFHTCCPPQAAFEAADRLGLYLQPEAPAWVDDWTASTVTKPPGIGRDPQVTDFLRAELRRMSEAYGNHPSFLLCAIGNEFGEQSTDWDRVNAMVEEIKRFDPRRLYTGCGARRHVPADDYWFTHSTGVSTRGVGPANTDWDFSAAVEKSPVPVIAHETGQRPVFPDYETLLPKFTGPLLPLNLERYRRALITNGLADQLPDFVRVSARFQLTQYKAEHEAMLRTPGYAGYQLLMLNDFTGQSEALVGILDPFYEPKGVVTAAEVRQWNAPTVVLARFAKYVWTSEETFTAKLQLAHYGASNLPAGLVHWTLEAADGKRLSGGEITTSAIPTGGVAELGVMNCPLDQVQAPAALTLRVRFGDAENHWNIWAYPAAVEESEPAGVYVTRSLDDEALRRLDDGGKVLLLAHGLKNKHAARTGWESVYWSAGWWGNKFSSLGVLCDPKHPALALFPNGGVSDWQWRDLCAIATTFELEGAPAGFRPIVQPVPDFHYNTLLGHVFEARVGPGSLLVCGYDLSNDLTHRPVARQFRRSLFRYVASPAFQPRTEVPRTWIQDRCGPTGLARSGARVIQVDSEDVMNGNPAENALDGDPATFWHTRWQPETDPLPHQLVIDLGKETTLRGMAYLPRQDNPNGRVAQYVITISNDRTNWITAAEGSFPTSAARQVVTFTTPGKARYLRFTALSELSNQEFASIAEIDIVP
jgi:beta-galactosidase